MAAGAPTAMFGPVDWNGGETARTMQSWPQRAPQYGGPMPLPEKEYTTSNFEIGRRVRCNAGQVHQFPDIGAGTSKRIHAFYHKTGTTAHRTEPDFRNTRGASSLTEANTDPLYSRPTFQSTAPLVFTRSARERAGIPVPTIRADSAITSIPDPEGAESYRSHRSARSGAKSDRSHHKSSPLPPPTGLSARSGMGQQWDTTPHTTLERMSWDFDRRPMYETAAMDYEKNWDAVPHPAAGKSWSGFMEPPKLMAMLTEKERNAQPLH